MGIDCKSNRTNLFHSLSISLEILLSLSLLKSFSLSFCLDFLPLVPLRTFSSRSIYFRSSRFLLQTLFTQHVQIEPVNCCYFPVFLFLFFLSCFPSLSLSSFSLSLFFLSLSSFSPLCRKENVITRFPSILILQIPEERSFSEEKKFFSKLEIEL